MSEESREQRWRRLNDEEEQAFERVRRNAETAGPAQRTNLTREWFAASHAVLIEHLRSHVVVHEDGPLEPYPRGAIGRAAKLMEALSTGNLPDPVKYATASVGRPDRWPGMRRDIATALHYITMAKRGDVKDRSFIVTVSEAFQVDRRTVQNWWRARHEIWTGVPEPSAQDFPEALREAGARYHFNRKGERTEGVK